MLLGLSADTSFSFLRATAHSAKRVLPTAKPYVRPSVCLSRAGIVPGTLKLQDWTLQDWTLKNWTLTN